MQVHASTQLPAVGRDAEHGVSPLFIHRWSPRAFAATPVKKETLDAMVEAARWAPSSINLQPWRFYVTNEPGATRERWNTAVGAGNRAWSDKAPVLVWVVARKVLGPNPYHPPETPNRHAFFDTGAAAIQFVLEGERHGLKAHYMGGVDVVKAHEILQLDADHEVVCAIAIGYRGDVAELPEGYRPREKPSHRKPANEVAVFA
jgi:nitroreductase